MLAFSRSSSHTSSFSSICLSNSLLICDSHYAWRVLTCLLSSPSTRGLGSTVTFPTVPITSQTPSNSPPLHSWRIPLLDHTPRSSQLSSPPLLDPSTTLPPLPLPISFMPTALPLSEISSWYPQDKTQFCTKTNGPPYSALQLGWAGRGEELQSTMGRQSTLECRGLPGSPPHVLLQRGAHRGPRAPGTEVRWAGEGLKQPLPGQ